MFFNNTQVQLPGLIVGKVEAMDPAGTITLEMEEEGTITVC